MTKTANDNKNTHSLYNELRAARSTGTIDGFLGVLAGKTKKIATLEEINEAAASGWAGEE
jgi:antitoxin PrlF